MEYRLSHQQAKAVSDILQCRTPAKGGVWKRCDECGRWEVVYKPCKNRHCPKCGAFEKAQWLEKQKVWLLPIPYYHVVFTVDHVFNPLADNNQKLFYNTFIRIATQLLKEYGRRYLGGEIGFTTVLHTWGQTMQRHIHLHCIVSGGALVASGRGYRWKEASRKYLFPVKLLSREFRDRFCREIARKCGEGEWRTRRKGGELEVGEMLKAALSHKWEVYIQRPIYGAEKLLEYLGRYIFRIAITNHRIVAVGKGKVTFKYRDNRDEGKEKQMSLSAEEFIRRYLSHVLPKGFVRIRHFGLHHGSCRKKLQHARRLLGLSFELPVIAKLRLADWLLTVFEEDVRVCKYCGKGMMRPVREFGAVSGWRYNLQRSLVFLLKWKQAFT